MPKPSKQESPWNPKPVPLMNLPTPTYAGSEVHRSQQTKARIVADHMKRSQLVSVAAAYTADTEAFDDFIFTGPEDPYRGKRAGAQGEDTASGIFSTRRFTQARHQAAVLGFSETDLRRAINEVQHSMRGNQVTHPFFPHHAFFDHAPL